MRNWRRKLLLLCGLGLAGCAVAPTETDELVYPWKDYRKERWKVVSMKKPSSEDSITEWVREGDDVKNWRELVTLRSASKAWGGASPKAFLAGMRAAREKNCPGATQWNVIREDETSVLYEWRSQPCQGWPALHEIAKIIDGKYKRFRLAYTITVESLPPEQRAKWLKMIAGSRTVAAAR